MSRYQGRDHLDVMDLAVRYNQAIFDDLARVALAAPRAHAEFRALDFGAGSGGFARRWAVFDGHPPLPLCVEPDPVLAEACASSGLVVFPDLSFIPPGSLDFIYSLNVLEHIEDDAGIVRDLAARLRPGGVLYLYLPAFPILYSGMDRRVGHFRRYRKAGLYALLEAQGFQVDEIRYTDSLGFFAALAYRWLGPKSGDLDPQGVAVYDRWIFPASQRLDLLMKDFAGKNVVAVASLRR